jgi:DNA-binding beta-propeller fold protein YncE
MKPVCYFSTSAKWLAGMLLFTLCLTPAHSELLLSGFHGIRSYDDVTGLFLQKIQNVGEEQEGIAFGPDGRLYSVVNDLGCASVVRFSGETYVYKDRFASSAGLVPFAMRFGPDGNLYISNVTWGDRTAQITKVNGVTGAYIGPVLKEAIGVLQAPFDFLFGTNDTLLVTDWFQSAGVLRFNAITGEFIDHFIPAGRGGLQNSTGLLLGVDGNLYVSSPATHSVLRYKAENGEFLDEFVTSRSGGLDTPLGLAFGPDGHLYVCSSGNHSVLRYDGKTGAFIDEFVASGSGGLDNGPNYLLFSPRAPRISITQTSEGLKLTWQGNGIKYFLQTCADFTTPWLSLTNFASREEATFLLRQSSTAEQLGFFRLKQAIE